MFISFKYFSLCLLIILAGCQSQERKQNSTDLTQKARAISEKYLIADLHVDVPYRLKNKFEDVSMATASGDFDYPRAKSGGLDAPFMSIYIPAIIEASGGDSTALAHQLIDQVEGIIRQAPDKFAAAYSSSEMIQNFDNGLISLPMGMENGSAIAADLSNVTTFHQRGIRYITLSHSLSNHISDSSYDSARPAQGLTDFGKQLVEEMNRVGVMVDVSHISDQAFYQVMEISQVPVIASHSSARHFTPGFERNMDDAMIRKLAKNGGVIFINFGSTFVSQKSIDNYNAFNKALEQFIQDNNIADMKDPQVEAFTKTYRAQTPFEYATLETVLDHFDHVVSLVGIKHVGIGSDYDGVGDSLPIGLKDVSTYPNLIEGLLKRGYSEADIEKILSGNLIRVWQQTERFAKRAM